MNNYDIIVVGSGPGGYVTAIRASQLGFKTAVVEKESLGGVCLNWGCIPTKALLKSAQVFEYLNHAEDYGLNAENISHDFTKVVKRSRNVASGMSKGVNFLMKKNKIDVLKGYGKLKKDKTVSVDGTDYKAKYIIIATGAKSRVLPSIPQDGKQIIGYREAMTLDKQPSSITIVGSGAIGIEFAYFFNSMGTEVTVIEYMPNIVPLEDVDVSKELEKSFKKKGIKIMTSSEVMSVEMKKNKVLAKVKVNGKEEVIESEILLSAVGIKSNIENIGLEDVGIATDKGRILVNDYYQTNIPGYYAIGDVIPGPALAHVASAEGIICVEKISGMAVEPMDMNNIPGCTYCSPEISSVGYTEKAAIDAGYEVKVGKFPFSASGKASAAGHKDGFVKVIFDAIRYNSAAIDVYYKTLRADDTTTFDDIEWEAMVLDKAVSDSKSRTDYREYTYEKSGLNGFIAFSIKIVMRGTSSCEVPNVRDFRAIALAL